MGAFATIFSSMLLTIAFLLVLRVARDIQHSSVIKNGLMSAAKLGSGMTIYFKFQFFLIY